MNRWIALLRGINVGGHNKIPMAELRAVSSGVGWQNVSTYIQSGNIAGESIAQRTDSLWIHYASGSAKTKITPVLLDRLAGSPVTTRNWRTVLKIGDMLD